MELATLGCLLANLLALFLSFLAAWQSSSNQGLAFLFGNGEVLGILSAAISSNVLENMAILSSASLNISGVISVIHWSWNASHLYDGPGGSFHTNFTWNARVTISQKLRMNYIRNSDALHMNFLRSSYKFLMNYTWNHISIFHVNFVCISYVRLVKITRSNAK